MSRYGVVTVGRLAIRESYSVSESNSDGTTTLTMAGQESSPRVSQTDMNRRREDILNSRGRFVAVTFSQKSQLNGYYWVSSSSAEWTHWDDHAMGALPWSMDLLRMGNATEIDIESKLGGSQTRLNDFLIVGERWHAPPAGHTNYYSGSSIATFVDRVGVDGTVRVYRNLALTTSPQWSCDELSYGAGRVRFLDGNDQERTGESLRTVPNDWELSNSLVRVRPLLASGVLEISHWIGGAWVPKSWDIQYGAVTLGVADAVSLLHNEPELTVLRLIKSLSGVRLSVDITLRRGSRSVELYVQAATSGTIKVARSTTEAASAGTGYIVATSGTDRYLLGSARTVTTTDLVNGSIALGSTVKMDVVISMVVAAAGPASGDAAVDLMKQYVGTPSETVKAVTR